ncbi:MAG TPA: ATP-binding protein, partial [Woeseiaceae bacterium]|nr:ATP-binding protein [Woeseiaceae bacterium]
ATRPKSMTSTPKPMHADSELRFQLLVQSVKDYAILLLDTDGRVTSWNEGAERIKGYAADEIIGRSFEAFYPEEAIATGFPSYELEVAAREGRFEDENWRVRKDGSRFWANVIITALRNAEGELVGYAKVTRDLTARREAEEQARRLAAERAAHQESARRAQELEELNVRLRDANRELQSALIEAENARNAAERATAAVSEAYRDLDQFAYVASHDLKAPLRGIANLAQWIQDDLEGQLTGDSGEHLALLQGRVRRMEGLIDGILAYSRAARTASEPEPVNTGDLVKEAIELIAPPEEVTVRVADDMPTMMAERVPLEQVFMNLVTNAIKYSSKVTREPCIEIDWRDTGDAFEFSVRDNGPGISPEYHQRIWGIFQTLAARDKVEGTGVGLAVVQKVVESRGGNVSVESTQGQGATFRFSWPKNELQEATG